MKAGVDLPLDDKQLKAKHVALNILIRCLAGINVLLKKIAHHRPDICSNSINKLSTVRA